MRHGRIRHSIQIVLKKTRIDLKTTCTTKIKLFLAIIFFNYFIGNIFSLSIVIRLIVAIFRDTFLVEIEKFKFINIPVIVDENWEHIIHIIRHQLGCDMPVEITQNLFRNPPDLTIISVLQTGQQHAHKVTQVLAECGTDGSMSALTSRRAFSRILLHGLF